MIAEAKQRPMSIKPSVVCPICLEEATSEFIQCENCETYYHLHIEYLSDSLSPTSLIQCPICKRSPSNLLSVLSHLNKLASFAIDVFMQLKHIEFNYKHHEANLTINRSIHLIKKHFRSVMYLRSLHKFLSNLRCFVSDFIEPSTEYKLKKRSILKANKELIHQLEDITSQHNLATYLQSKSHRQQFSTPETSTLIHSLDTNYIKLNRLRKLLHKSPIYVQSGSIITCATRFPKDSEEVVCEKLMLIVRGFELKTDLYDRNGLFLYTNSKQVDEHVFEAINRLEQLYKPAEYISDFMLNLLISHELPMEFSYLPKFIYENMFINFWSTKFINIDGKVGMCPSCHGGVYKDSNSKYFCCKCRAEICARCFQIKTNGHVCKREDMNEWRIIQETTKACPRCGYRFGHHSDCDNMFCTNCQAGFNYSTRVIIEGEFENIERTEYLKRMKQKMNERISSTLRQYDKSMITQIVETMLSEASKNYNELIRIIASFVSNVFYIYQRVNENDIKKDIVDAINKDIDMELTKRIVIVKCMKSVTMNMLIAGLELIEDMLDVTVDDVECAVCEMIEKSIDIKVNELIMKELEYVNELKKLNVDEAYKNITNELILNYCDLLLKGDVIKTTDNWTLMDVSKMKCNKSIKNKINIVNDSVKNDRDFSFNNFVTWINNNWPVTNGKNKKNIVIDAYIQHRKHYYELNIGKDMLTYSVNNRNIPISPIDLLNKNIRFFTKDGKLLSVKRFI